METVIGDYPEFLLVNKPPGRDFHDSDGVMGFFNAVKLELGLSDLWPVHRLDKPTSGVLLMAKNKIAAHTLAELFAKQQISKCYLALAQGKPKKKQGKVQGDMVRSRRGTWRLERSLSRPAITHFDSTSFSPGTRLYSLQPKTGKTHQLRVAMKSLSTPILGDSPYGGAISDRTYLHAYSLGFVYKAKRYFWQCIPQDGELFLSSEFRQSLAALEQKIQADFP